MHVLPFGQTPQTRHVRGSNMTFIGVAKDRVPGRAIVISALDNLVKGASGQAVQNMNLMLGYPETHGAGAGRAVSVTQATAPRTGRASPAVIGPASMLDIEIAHGRQSCSGEKTKEVEMKTTLLKLTFAAAMMIGMASTGAVAQTAEPTFKGDPDVYKVIFEDANFRVIEANRKKGVHDKAHGHPVPSIVYSLTDCKTKQYAADGKDHGRGNQGRLGQGRSRDRVAFRREHRQRGLQADFRREEVGPAVGPLDFRPRAFGAGPACVQHKLHHPEDRQHQDHLRDPAAGERERAQHRNAGGVDRDIGKPAPEKQRAGERRRRGVDVERLRDRVPAARTPRGFRRCWYARPSFAAPRPTAACRSATDWPVAPIVPRTMMRSRM